MTLNYVIEDNMEPFEEGAKKAARKAKAAGKKARAIQKIAQKGQGEVEVKGVTIDANAANELTQAVQDRQNRASGDTASPLDVLAQARKSAQVAKRAAKKGEGGVSVSMNNEIMTTTAAPKATPGSKARVRITGATGRGEEKPKPKTDTKPYQRRGGWGREEAPAADEKPGGLAGAVDTAVAGGLKAAGKFVGKVVRGATAAVQNRADAEKAAGQKSAAAAVLRSKIRSASGDERANLNTELNTLKSSGAASRLTTDQRSAIRNIGRTKGDVSAAKPDAGIQQATGVKVGVIKRGGDAPAAKRAEPGPMAGRADGGSGSSRADISSKVTSAGSGGADTRIGASSKVPAKPPAPKPKADDPKPKPKADAPAPKADDPKPKPKADAPAPKADDPKPKPKADAPKPKASSDGASQPGMTQATGVRPKKKSPQDLAQKRALSQATGIKVESLKAMLKAICQQKRKMSRGCVSLTGGGLTDAQRQILAAISKRKPAKFKGDKPKTANIAPGNATAPANLPKSFVGKSGQHRPGKNNDGTDAREQKKDESLARIIASQIAKLMS